MNASDEERVDLETLGIPKTEIHWPEDLDSTEEIIMDIPSDLDSALREMKRGKVITLEEFKKEFKGWRGRIIRMAGFNMVFTRHFESQLNTVLNYHTEQRGGSTGFSSALFECLCWDLRKLPKSLVKNSYPTTSPNVRFIMPMGINVTFHFMPDVITVLSICNAHPESYRKGDRY